MNPWSCTVRERKKKLFIFREPVKTGSVETGTLAEAVIVESPRLCQIHGAETGKEREDMPPVLSSSVLPEPPTGQTQLVG